jgi:hypothetical protein
MHSPGHARRRMGEDGVPAVSSVISTSLHVPFFITMTSPGRRRDRRTQPRGIGNERVGGRG